MIPVVVGIDPSLQSTGIATPAGVQTIRSEGKKDATLRQRCARLHDLATDISMAVTEAHRPGVGLLVAIERQIPTAGGHAHDRSGLWWLVVDEIFAGGTSNFEVVEITPSQRMKYATGTGRADKDEVLAAVIRRYPDVATSNNNEADALVFRAMALDYLGQPLVTVPKSHRDALNKVAWPVSLAPGRTAP